MKKIVLPLLVILFSFVAYGQNTFKASIKDAKSKEPLVGVTAIIQGTSNGASADVNGTLEIKNIPNGKQVIIFRFIGYNQRVDTIVFPLSSADPIEILLEEGREELNEVTVSSTRSSRSISDIPTRIETITAEELDEKASMQPSNIKMILTESTGIQTQQM